MPDSKADRTRQHIIQSAAPLFNRKGYADTSLSDVVAATGLTKGAIYGNFADKDELALAVFQYNFAQLRQGLISAMDAGAGAVGRLQGFVQFYRDHYAAIARGGGCALLNAAVEADDNYPLLKPKVRSALRSWEKLLVDTIRSGQEEGSIRTAADPKHYAQLFIALIEGGIMMAKVLDSAEPLMRSLSQVDLIVRDELGR